MKTMASIGLDGLNLPPAVLTHTVNLKLAGLGCAPVQSHSDEDFQEVAWAILSHHHRRRETSGRQLCPSDRRIEQFLSRYLACENVKLPDQTLVLDRYGLARALSIPADSDEFASPILNSYRVQQGVLHNPRSDRRTTEGIFHIAEGGLPIPNDKKAVPAAVFERMLNFAFLPPRDLLLLPYTAHESKPAEVFVSLLLRPLVCPAVRGYIAQKSMEIRFFAPGSLVSNVDFVESIFGNAGDPFLPENDAALDVHHWTGHTGCVILAPHLPQLSKKDLGLPHFDKATSRQRRDKMCWKSEDERYNEGKPFKLTARDASGVMVTIIADNYFGYCKKEVKTQISFAANLFGLCEEEHAGGALVYASYDLGQEFSGDLHVRRLDHSHSEVCRIYSAIMDLQPEGHGIDRYFPEIVYVPEDVHFDLQKRTVSWPFEGGSRSIPLRAGKVYVRPSGYKVRMEKLPVTHAWHLVGTVAEPLVCHKPCTVSGGGKSEISKSISDAILQGPVFIAEFKRDFDRVERLIERDYSDRFKDPEGRGKDSRPILSHERSLGSVIKLLTPSVTEYNGEYNDWLNTIPQYIKELVFVVKRFYKPEWGEHWRARFSVDIVNGKPGNELKFENCKLIANYLRIGFDADGSWRTFGLRSDFQPALKVSAEDDITASVVVPSEALDDGFKSSGKTAFKFVQNCEYRLFQRPDDAIHRGYDKQTELDFSQPDNFFSNYEPLTRTDAKALIEDAISLEEFTEPMQRLIKTAARNETPKFFVSTAHPRMVDGKPSKNPRYLQTRPDLVRPMEKYLGDMTTRMFRRLSLGAPVFTPVSAVVPGRRNNPPDLVAGIRPLAVYNPIHYMELPELFMEFICSMTGKSPSTTGAGSEGALTKGPFNALPTIYDLNNALVSYLLTEADAFITAAGYIGPNVRVDHDISLLVPEIWSRMSEDERKPQNLIASGCLERCHDFYHEGKLVMASRLGYRITLQFVILYFGRVFNHPHVVCTPEMLRPEIQDRLVFMDGMDNIVSTQKRVAENFFEDGTVEFACPPLKALLHIMAYGQFEGKDLQDAKLRGLFTKEALLQSQWYRDRLTAKQEVDNRLWTRHIADLEHFLSNPGNAENELILTIKDRLLEARSQLHQAQSAEYLEFLHGSIGAQPLAGARS